MYCILYLFIVIRIRFQIPEISEKTYHAGMYHNNDKTERCCYISLIISSPRVAVPKTHFCMLKLIQDVNKSKTK